jgi:hypothetical protein
MAQLEIELTAIDIVILSDLIYEQVARLWMNGEWCYPRGMESNVYTAGLNQSYYDGARNDKAAANGFPPRESLAQEYRAEQDHEHHTQFIDRSYSGSRANL